jgi:membrane protein implicated in regulation of membrane protease activity
MVFPINDALDAILLGSFLFGILFTVGAFLLGAADIGGDAGDASAGDHGADHMFNITSILAFITWFGGVGYVVRNGTGWNWAFALGLALIAGFGAAWVVKQFITKILRAGEDTLDPKDFQRVGTLARVTSTIRPGGVGEIVWEQRGARMVGSARSTSESPIARGTEVLIMKVERGIAIVEPFDGLLAGEGQAL